METAGKRGKRIAQANIYFRGREMEFCFRRVADAQPGPRRFCRVYTARENESLLAREDAAQSNVVRLLQGQLAAALVSSFDVTQARVARTRRSLARQDAIGQTAPGDRAIGRCARPATHALEGIEFDFGAIEKFADGLDRAGNSPRGRC